MEQNKNVQDFTELELHKMHTQTIGLISQANETIRIQQGNLNVLVSEINRRAEISNEPKADATVEVKEEPVAEVKEEPKA